MRIDGVRLDDLTPFSVVWGTIGVMGALAATHSAVQNAIGGDIWTATGAGAAAVVIVAVFLKVAYDDAKPEYSTECDACGADIEINTGSNRREGVLVARLSKAPRRLHLGPISIVAEKRRDQWEYCSTGCAVRDAPPECSDFVSVDEPAEYVDPVGKWTGKDGEEEVAD